MRFGLEIEPAITLIFPIGCQECSFLIESGLGSLFDTYVGEAAPFAAIHALLLVACLRVWVYESIRVHQVRGQLDSVKAGSNPSSETTLGQAFDYVIGLAAKGRLVDPGSLQSFFRNAWQSADGPFHSFLNAFVISGILGTLYNLWRVREVLQQIVSSNGTAQASIGIVGVAFTASIFGLGFSLILGAADALFFQPRRDRLVKDAVEWLIRETVDRTPLSAEAMLARSIDDLREFNKEVVKGVAAGLETLAREYATRFDGLAAKAKSDMDGITAEWSQALKSSRKTLDTASTNVSQASERLDAKRESIEAAVKVVADAQATLTSSVESVGATVTDLLKETSSQVKQSTDAWTKITAAHEGRVVRLHAGIKQDAVAGVQAITTATDEAIKKVADKENALTGAATALEESVNRQSDAGIQAISTAATSALRTVADSKASLNAAVGVVRATAADIVRTARTELDTALAERRTLAPVPAARVGPSNVPDRTSPLVQSPPVPAMAGNTPPSVDTRQPYDSVHPGRSEPGTAVPQGPFEGASDTNRNSVLEALNYGQRHDSRLVRAFRRVAGVFGLD